MAACRRRAIEDATRLWIHKFVVRERLCPFAAPSRILVRVDTFGHDNSKDTFGHGWKLDPLHHKAHAELAFAALGRAERWIDEIVGANTSNDNLFIVWPAGLADLAMYKSFAALLAHRAGLYLAGTSGEGADAPAVAFPFHPEMAQASPLGPADYRFVSPWPMVHIIPQVELSRARQQLRKRKVAGKTCLLARNVQIMQEATSAQHKDWNELLADCRRTLDS